MSKRAERKYEERKAKSGRQEEGRQAEIDAAMEKQSKGQRALSRRELQMLGYPTGRIKARFGRR